MRTMRRRTTMRTRRTERKEVLVSRRRELRIKRTEMGTTMRTERRGRSEPTTMSTWQLCANTPQF